MPELMTVQRRPSSTWLFLLALSTIGGSATAQKADNQKANNQKASNQRTSGPLKASSVAPDFISIDADGNEVRLSDFAGKVVVLDFWATWCRPCLASLPHVQELTAEHAKHDVVTLAVCTSDSRKRFEEWVAEHAKEYPAVRFTCDPNDRGSDSFEQRASSQHYHVEGLPTKFVIGKDGKVVLSIVGHEADDKRLEAGLARAGVAIDADAITTGEQQIKKDEAAAAAAALVKRPPFWPSFGSIKGGEAIPEAGLRAVDGTEWKLSSLHGKPYVLVFAWAEIMPHKKLQELAETYGSYGVEVVAAFVNTTPAEYQDWVAERGTEQTYRMGFDAAGKYEPSGKEFSQEEYMAFSGTTMLAKFWHGNMRPPMPTMIAVDGDGKLLGSFPQDRVRDGLGNLLLHAGVELREEHRPEVVVAEAAFRAPAAPKKPESPVAELAIGSMAPDFTMQDHAGDDVKLSDYRGKVVVLDFWATWCGPCKAAMPHVQSLAKQYADQGVVVIASCTSDERALFENWVAKNGGEYADVVFAHDSAEKSPERASRRLFGVGGIPHQFVIDRDGKVAASVVGYRVGEVLLDAALAKAGIQVDAAVIEKAAADQVARDKPRTQKAAVPLRMGG